MKRHLRAAAICAAVFVAAVAPVAAGSASSFFSEESVARAILRTSDKYGIEPEILYTIVGIESDFKPLAIAVETTRESAKVLTRLREEGIKVVFSEKRRTFHSKRHIVSIYPQDFETAKYIIRLLEEGGFCFDVGLAQINTYNFTIDEVDKLFLPRKNLDKAGKVFAHCSRIFRSLPYRVECYNRGAGNLLRDIKRAKREKRMLRMPYYARFASFYGKSFGFKKKKKEKKR